MKRFLAWFSALFVAPFFVVSAANIPEKNLSQLVDDYLAKRPTKATPTGLSLADAQIFQRRYVAELSKKLGPAVGYKVGLVAEATQQRYGVKAPVRGVLLRDMMLKDGVELPMSFASRPLFEADLVAVVKDDGINSATTPLEAARHLSEIIGFIELPDLVVDPSVTVDGPMLVANNVGARAGVLGQRVPIKAAQEFVDAIGNITLIMTDETGHELVRAKGSLILGHPLNAVTWLAKDLAATGEKLKAGDLISLGSVAAPLTPKAGQRIQVRYEGLPGGVFGASVKFK
jgi:2-keto-4-pentenoate hydratase